MSDNCFVYYPGHLGARAMTELTQETGILWDAPVKRIPERFADSLVNDGGFQRALSHAEARQRLALTKKQLDAHVDAGHLNIDHYQPGKGQGAVPVVVVPAGMTTTALKSHLQALATEENSHAG